MEYHPINSISEIDLSKITPVDLHKRYIDPEGNRYAVKFNARNRKLRVVQIIKGKNEIYNVRSRIRSTKTTAVPQTSDKEKPEPPPNAFDEVPASEKPGMATKFQRAKVTEDFSRELTKSRERIIAVLNHMKKSTYFDKDPDPRSKNQLADLERKLENGALALIDKANSLINELDKFPRPLNYYINKLDDNRKLIIGRINEDSRKLERIKEWELQRSFGTAIDTAEENLGEIKSALNDFKDNVVSQLNYQQKQSISDAKISVDFAMQELRKLEQKNSEWMAYSAN